VDGQEALGFCNCGGAAVAACGGDLVADCNRVDYAGGKAVAADQRRPVGVQPPPHPDVGKGEEVGLGLASEGHHRADLDELRPPGDCRLPAGERPGGMGAGQVGGLRDCKPEQGCRAKEGVDEPVGERDVVIDNDHPVEPLQRPRLCQQVVEGGKPGLVGRLDDQRQPVPCLAQPAFKRPRLALGPPRSNDKHLCRRLPGRKVKQPPSHQPPKGRARHLPGPPAEPVQTAYGPALPGEEKLRRRRCNPWLVVLFVHNRYRNPGGEEAVVARLEGLVESRLGLAVGSVQADSGDLSPFLAARFLLAGGSGKEAQRVGSLAGEGVVVHAHNLHPAFGVRALRGAKRAGAKVILHLHQFRLVCAVGVCFTAGRSCTACHGRNTLPGMLKRCRGGFAESALYAAALALWQPALLGQADAFLLPSRFALGRLAELGIELGDRPTEVLYPPIERPRQAARRDGGYALIASRLSAEKGVDLGLRACALAQTKVVVAGDGPQRERLEALAKEVGAKANFVGRLERRRLDELLAGAAVAVVPSRAENFPTAAAEAMAWGVPVAATAVGGTPELVPEGWLAPPDSPAELAARIARLAGDREAGELARERVGAVCDPERIAAQLGRLYRTLGLRPQTAGRGRPYT